MHPRCCWVLVPLGWLCDAAVRWPVWLGQGALGRLQRVLPWVQAGLLLALVAVRVAVIARPRPSGTASK